MNVRIFPFPLKQGDVSFFLLSKVQRYPSQSGGIILKGNADIRKTMLPSIQGSMARKRAKRPLVVVYSRLENATQVGPANLPEPDFPAPDLESMI